jgi:hypothetical protein
MHVIYPVNSLATRFMRVRVWCTECPCLDFLTAGCPGWCTLPMRKNCCAQGHDKRDSCIYTHCWLGGVHCSWLVCFGPLVCWCMPLCLHLVAYHHNSLHTTPVRRFIPYVPRLASYHIDLEVTQKEPSRSLRMALRSRNMWEPSRKIMRHTS